MWAAAFNSFEKIFWTLTARFKWNPLTHFVRMLPNYLRKNGHHFECPPTMNRSFFVLDILQTFGATDAWTIGCFCRCVVEELSTQTISSSYTQRWHFLHLGALFFILIVPTYLKGNWGGLCVIYRDFNLPVFSKITDCYCFSCFKIPRFCQEISTSLGLSRLILTLSNGFKILNFQFVICTKKHLGGLDGMAAMKNLRTESSKGSCSANCYLPLPPGTSWSQISILAADYSNA